MRAVTVRAISLTDAAAPVQTDLFSDFARHEQQEKLDAAVRNIRTRYGKNSIFNACLLCETAIPHDAPEHAVLPRSIAYSPFGK